jgi:hypothetical protein
MKRVNFMQLFVYAGKSGWLGLIAAGFSESNGLQSWLA